jgi:site-specific DNA-methyltransferase (adenine-specific)
MQALEKYRNKILCMDNREGLKLLPDNCIDLTVTSPPYDNLRDYKGYSFDFETVAQELYRVTKQGGVVVWVVGDATVNGSETLTSFRQAIYFKDVCGFNIHDTMIWTKTGQGAVGSTLAYWQNFEYMIICSKGKPKTFNPLQDRKNKVVGIMSTTGGRKSDGTYTTRRKIKGKEFGRRFNVWEINQETTSDHPAPFPEALARDHILSWSNPGDLILDPFMGSGTTAKMAAEFGRDYIGFEISQEYCDIAEKRVKEATAQLRLFTEVT